MVFSDILTGKKTQGRSDGFANITTFIVFSEFIELLSQIFSKTRYIIVTFRVSSRANS